MKLNFNLETAEYISAGCMGGSFAYSMLHAKPALSILAGIVMAIGFFIWNRIKKGRSIL